MLSIPETGFSKSTKTHNCSVTVVCDWIEASLLEDETEISQTKIADILHEQNFYEKDGQSNSRLCDEFLAILWTELERRQRLAGQATIFNVSGKRVSRVPALDSAIVNSYLLVLSCAEYYKELREKKITNYVLQGELFEDFCCESLNSHGWIAKRTGWSSTKGAKKLPATVEAISRALNETDINNLSVKRFTNDNEAGCDLVSHWPYDDEHAGRPVVLLQCASGIDFKHKLATPDIQVWCNLIAFSTIPLRGFCTPFAFDRGRFESHSRKVRGLFLDRYRLLQPLANKGISKALERRIKAWMKPRIKALPLLN